jgi:uncharacterized protein (TIGR04562 family)
MQEQTYLKDLKFNWETLDVMIGGLSALDVNSYLGRIDTDDNVLNFIKGYGYDYDDPVQQAELFGNYQEAIQFIKRYFLKEGSAEGLDLKIPGSFFTITDITQLFLMASRIHDNKVTEAEMESAIWAGIILKVMHTILHTDKDLRYRYFSAIQLQIFDRFYKYIHREGEKLFLKIDENNLIELVEFETKSKKTRASTIIKLLHKKENVAEELFDRIGIRFVTKTKLDVLRVLKFLHRNYVVMPHNIKPSRSINTLFNMKSFREEHTKLTRKAEDDNLSEQQYTEALEDLLVNSNNDDLERINKHSSDDYKSIHFTCRQLIKYKNPFMDNFSSIKKLAKKSDKNDELAQKILSIDTSLITRDIRFFYPYEVQITDEASHEKNTEGDASHVEYKKTQVNFAMLRIFKTLIEFKNITV